jgi:uncharacterized protein YigE (DUF2233 family)
MKKSCLKKLFPLSFYGKRGLCFEENMLMGSKENAHNSENCSLDKIGSNLKICSLDKNIHIIKLFKYENVHFYKSVHNLNKDSIF